MASSGAEIVKFIKLQEDTMKLQQQLYISFLPNTSADDKIKMLQNLRRQSVNITTFKEQLLSTLQPLKNNYLKKKNRKQLNLVAYLKKTMVN